jgi:hypothetical protein
VPRLVVTLSWYQEMDPGVLFYSSPHCWILLHPSISAYSRRFESIDVTDPSHDRSPHSEVRSQQTATLPATCCLRFSLRCPSSRDPSQSSVSCTAESCTMVGLQVKCSYDIDRRMERSRGRRNSRRMGVGACVGLEILRSSNMVWSDDG